MTHSDEVSELLPCPFCGSADVDPTGWASTESAGPACNGCGASAGGVKFTVEQNAAAWNRRSASNTAGDGSVVGDDINNLCICQNCQRPYVTDMLVPDDAWEAIKPEGCEVGAGLLCPTCIMDRASDRLGWSVGFVYPERHGAAITAGKAAGGGVKLAARAALATLDRGRG